MINDGNREIILNTIIIIIIMISYDNNNFFYNKYKHNFVRDYLFSSGLSGGEERGVGNKW